jgi:hypothetical protein
MFHQEQQVLVQLTLNPLAAEGPLQVENLTIGSATEVLDQ